VSEPSAILVRRWERRGDESVARVCAYYSADAEKPRAEIMYEDRSAHRPALTCDREWRLPADRVGLIGFRFYSLSFFSLFLSLFSLKIIIFILYLLFLLNGR